jgi:hypothetical protein
LSGHERKTFANRSTSAPESCAVAREGLGEALTGERIGQPLSRESFLFWVPTPCIWRKATRQGAPSRALGHGQRPWHVQTLLARGNREISRSTVRQPPPQLGSRRTKRSQPQRSRWSEGRGPRGTRTSKARTGHRAGSACHKRWSAYGKVRRHTPKAGAVCGNSARTDLSGGRSVMTVPTALQCEYFAF